MSEALVAIRAAAAAIAVERDRLNQAWDGLQMAALALGGDLTMETSAPVDDPHLTPQERAQMDPPRGTVHIERVAPEPVPDEPEVEEPTEDVDQVEPSTHEQMREREVEEREAEVEHQPKQRERAPEPVSQTGQGEWWTRNQIVGAEQFAHDVYESLRKLGTSLPQEIIIDLGLAPDVDKITDAVKNRVGVALRTMEQRDVIARSGLTRRPTGVDTGRNSIEWAIRGAWTDRDGIVWESSRANPQ